MSMRHLAFHRIYPDAFLLGLLHGQNSSANTELMLSVARRWLADEMGDRLVREMDEAGIASSVLLIIDGGVRFGDPSMSIEQIYEVHRCLLSTIRAGSSCSRGSIRGGDEWVWTSFDGVSSSGASAE